MAMLNRLSFYFVSWLRFQIEEREKIQLLFELADSFMALEKQAQ